MALTVLVTGATGYIGGRLVPRLLAEGHAVRAMTPDAARLRDVPWAQQVDVVEADALDPPSLTAALAGVDVAYYLIHSIDTGEFERTDRQAAQAFAITARDAGVGRIVYLGGLSPESGQLSAHLRSRQEVGDVLLASGVPTVVLQAAVIAGQRLGVVRDAAPPQRAAPGDDHAALGPHTHPADRRPRRPSRSPPSRRRCRAGSTSAGRRSSPTSR